MRPCGSGEAIASALECLRDNVILGVSVVGAALVLATILGVFVSAHRHRRRLRQAKRLTELARGHDLRTQSQRLAEDVKRLRRERLELLGILRQISELIERHERTQGPH